MPLPVRTRRRLAAMEFQLCQADPDYVAWMRAVSTALPVCAAHPAAGHPEMLAPTAEPGTVWARIGRRSGRTRYGPVGALVAIAGVLPWPCRFRRRRWSW
jgi:hypothetical protein